jgi:hypothetical protein
MDRLAEYLLKKETITGAEFMAILHGEDPAKALAAEQAKEEGKSKIEISADSTASTPAFAEGRPAKTCWASTRLPARHSLPSRPLRY